MTPSFRLFTAILFKNICLYDPKNLRNALLTAYAKELLHCHQEHIAIIHLYDIDVHRLTFLFEVRSLLVIGIEI